MDQLLTRADVARLLRVCTKSVDRYVSEDGLPALSIGGRVMTRPADLEKWIESRPKRQRWREPGTIVILPDNGRGDGQTPLEFYDVESTTTE